MSNEFKVFSYWENPIGEMIPPYIDECIKSAKRQCNEFVLITPENVGEYLDDNDLHPNWKNLQYIAHRADCVRVAIIEKYGGLWVDCDTVFIRPVSLLNDYLIDGKEFYYLQWDDGRVLNGYFYAKQHCIVMKKWIETINNTLKNIDNLKWTSFGEQILTPLVLWDHKDICHKLDRSMFLPINIDRIPAIFFERVSYRNFVTQSTIAVGLNHSWMANNCPQIKTKMVSDIISGNQIISQIFKDSKKGYRLTKFDETLQDICQRYSIGSMSIGDIEVIVNFFEGMERVVELGTNHGTTTRILSRLVKYVITIDVFEDLDNIINNEWREFYKHNFKNNPHSFDCVKGYLSDCKNVEVIKNESSIESENVDNDSIDGIFIDADHSYEGVSRDFGSWFQKIKIGGIILIHDNSKGHPGVEKFCSDLNNVDYVENISYMPSTFYTSIAVYKKISERK